MHCMHLTYRQIWPTTKSSINCVLEVWDSNLSSHVISHPDHFDHLCRISEYDRNWQKSKHRIRLLGMNTHEHVIRRHVRDFDGVYRSDNLLQNNHHPNWLWLTLIHRIDPVNIRYPSTSTETKTENTSTHSVDLHRQRLNAIWTYIVELGHITVLSIKVLLVNFVDSTASFGVCLSVETV